VVLIVKYEKRELPQHLTF